MYESVRQRSGPELGARLTKHASQRMGARGISESAVRTVLEHGRVVHVRGAAVHAIGRKEVRCLDRRGIDLSPYEGIQVVCTPDGTILTTYRNRDFRGLRPRCRGRWTRTPRTDIDRLIGRRIATTLPGVERRLRRSLLSGCGLLMIW